MKKGTWFLAAILVVATVAAVPFVYGGPGRGHGPLVRHHGFGGGMGFLGHIAEVREELGLSDGQVDQIKAIFKDLHEQNGANRDQLHGGIESIARTLIANPNDVATAQALIDRQAEAERAWKTNMLAAMSKALNILTPDQRAKLGTLIEERMSVRKERMSHRRSRER